jgi:hypothetical protein
MRLQKFRPLHQALAIVLAFALAAILGSCVEVSTQHAGGLHTHGTALISIPLDATYEGRLYSGSGKETAQVVATAFRRHLQRVEIMSGTAFASSMDATGASHYDYFVIPTIIQWEDRSVRRRNREDHVEIGIRVLRARDGVTLAEWRVKKPSTVSTIFKASPAEQLTEAIDENVAGLFSRQER